MFPLNPSPLLRMQGLDPLMSMANGGGDGPDIPPPDKNIGKAALMSAATGERALDWYMGIYAQDEPYRKRLQDLSVSIGDTQLDASRQNQEIADDYYGYMKNTFRPVEAGIVDEASRYNLEAERERQASAAAADVEGAAANRRTQLARSLAAMGVNPNSPRFAALNHDASIMDAASRAGSMTKARQNAEQLGWAKRIDAASIGRNLPANQATSQGIALNAGQAAMGTAAAPGANSAMYANMMGQGFNSAMQGYNQQGNLLNNQYQTQVNGAIAQSQAAAQSNSSTMNAIGSIAGAVATYYLMAGSSKEIKKDKHPVGPVLKGLRKVPVESWQYKEGKGDGGSHVGPYAEDVNREFGDKVAPQGKMIDIISMLGVNTAAIKELDKKVSKLEKKE